MKKALFLLTLMPLLGWHTGAKATWFNNQSTLVDTQSPATSPLPYAEPLASPGTDEANSNDIAPENATQFAKVIDDLPLMPGLSLIPETDVLFGNARSGRLAETITTGTVDIDDVYRFYRASLPPLGWKAVDGRTYMRDGEQLRIDAKATGKVATVRFNLKPAN